ncbi:hypothetical protein DFH06DRAFT_1121044 [Mycena polygramma]|nr:hypothetical protein DFH06DRAFT_1121044 [Mycena polygramma]
MVSISFLPSALPRAHPGRPSALPAYHIAPALALSESPSWARRTSRRLGRQRAYSRYRYSVQICDGSIRGQLTDRECRNQPTNRGPPSRRELKKLGKHNPGNKSDLGKKSSEFNHSLRCILIWGNRSDFDNSELLRFNERSLEVHPPGRFILGGTDAVLTLAFTAQVGALEWHFAWAARTFGSLNIHERPLAPPRDSNSQYVQLLYRTSHIQPPP